LRIKGETLRLLDAETLASFCCLKATFSNEADNQQREPPSRFCSDGGDEVGQKHFHCFFHPRSVSVSVATLVCFSVERSASVGAEDRSMSFFGVAMPLSFSSEGVQT